MANASNRVVLVTGANGALGSAVVARCAADGARVVALERSKNGEVKLEPLSGNGVRLHASLSDAGALADALARAAADVGPLTGAVLTAGTWRGGHKFHENQAAADYRIVMDANLETTQVALRAILPGMVQREH